MKRLSQESALPTLLADYIPKIILKKKGKKKEEKKGYPYVKG